jgi:hypothetical protein
VVWEGKVVVLGGEQKEVEVYDVVAKKWSRDSIPTMLVPSRNNLAAVSF